MADRLLAELRRSLEFYTTQENGAPVQRILLTGGSARLPGLAAYLEKRLGVPTQVAEGWGELRLPDGKYGPEFHAVFGLSLQTADAGAFKINLIPEDLHIRKRAERQAAETKRLIACAVLGMGLALTVGWFKYDGRRKLLAEREATLNATVQVNGRDLVIDGTPIAHKDVLDRMAAIDAERTRVKERFETISGLMRNRREWVPILAEIQRMLPSDNTWVEGSGVSLAAASPTLGLLIRTTVYDEIQTLVKYLQTSRYFTSTTENLDIRKVEVDGIEIWEFPVSLELRPIPEEEAAPAAAEEPPSAPDEAPAADTDVAQDTAVAPVTPDTEAAN